MILDFLKSLKIRVVADTGYQGLQKIHGLTAILKKRNKKLGLSKEDKKNNQKLASERVLNENVIGVIKRF